jgi:NADP-dependent 3-hydroxy acid dehydrogenase YdfG
MVNKINVIIIGCSSGLGKHLALAYGKYQNVYKSERGISGYENFLVKNAGKEDLNGTYIRVEDKCGFRGEGCRNNYIKEDNDTKHLFCNNGGYWVLDEQNVASYYRSPVIDGVDTPPLDRWEAMNSEGGTPPSIEIEDNREILNMLLVSRRMELLTELKKNLERSDREIEICVQDITEDKAPKNIFDKWKEKFDTKKIDHLICNAGILVKASPKDINLKKNPETWKKLYKTNYLSHRNIVEYALGLNDNEEIMLNQNSHIAITNSSEGKRYFPTPNNYFGAYGKTKKMMEKWVTHSLRKDKVVIENKINITVMYPSKIDGPMFFHILEKDGKRTKRKPEWEILGFKEPHKKFDDYNLDVLALRYYLAIQTNKKEEYSSLVDRIIIKHLPEPFSFFFFYSIGLTKKLSLLDIPLYLLLQFPFEIPILSKMFINNFYIKDNRITKKDIKEKNYQLNESNIKDDESLLYRYYIFNTIVLFGIGYYVNKKFNGSILKKIYVFFNNLRKK